MNEVMMQGQTLCPDGPRGRERRVSIRYPRGGLACYQVGSTGHESRWALVRDVSAGGIGLRLAGPLESGTPLHVEFREPGTLTRISMPARVVHCTGAGDGTWLIGCRFDTPLPEEQVRKLL